MSDKSISFELSPQHAEVIRAIAGNREVRITATLVEGNKARIDLIAFNPPLVISTYGPYDKLQG
jgi:hypothetical protein